MFSWMIFAAMFPGLHCDLHNAAVPAESIFGALQAFFFFAFYGMIWGDGGMTIRRLRGDESGIE